jgi:hypothetical protein
MLFYLRLSLLEDEESLCLSRCRTSCHPNGYFGVLRPITTNSPRNTSRLRNAETEISRWKKKLARVWIIKGVIESNVMNERQQLASWTSIYQICHTGIIFARNTRKGFKTIISFFHMDSNSLLPKETSDDKKWSKPMSLPSVIQVRRSVVPCCRSFYSHTILGMVHKLSVERVCTLLQKASSPNPLT